MKNLIIILSLLISVSGIASELPQSLIFPPIHSTLDNNAKLDLNDLKIVIVYTGDHIDPIVQHVQLNPKTAQYSIPEVTIPYGPVDFFNGNYFSYTVTAFYKGSQIARMSDINVWTWEKRGYSLEEFKQMYIRGLSTLSLGLLEDEPYINQPYITGN